MSLIVLFRRSDELINAEQDLYFIFIELSTLFRKLDYAHFYTLSH